MDFELAEDESDAYCMLYTMLDFQSGSALVRDADGVAHTIALHVPESCLEEVLKHVVSLHNFTLLLPLLCRAKRTLYVETAVLGFLHCSESCVECRAARKSIVAVLRNQMFAPGRFYLDTDEAELRAKIQTYRRQNVYRMHWPMLMLNCRTDALFQVMQQRTQQLWKLVLFACFAKRLWKVWMTAQLEPGSRYIRNLALRFKEKLSIQQ
jgi:hypothetical protein